MGVVVLQRKMDTPHTLQYGLALTCDYLDSNRGGWVKGCGHSRWAFFGLGHGRVFQGGRAGSVLLEAGGRGAVPCFGQLCCAIAVMFYGQVFPKSSWVWRLGGGAAASRDVVRVGVFYMDVEGL